MELPSLSWLADTQEDGLGGLRDLVAEVVRDLTDTGEPVPEPLSSRSYSGKFNLRVGEQLHRRLAIEAVEEHLSLNQSLESRLPAPGVSGIADRVANVEHAVGESSLVQQLEVES